MLRKAQSLTSYAKNSKVKFLEKRKKSIKKYKFFCENIVTTNLSTQNKKKADTKNQKEKSSIGRLLARYICKHQIAKTPPQLGFKDITHRLVFRRKGDYRDT